MFDNLKAEIKAIKEKDPAARSTLEIFLCYPGFWALLMHRIVIGFGFILSSFWPV